MEIDVREGRLWFRLRGSYQELELVACALEAWSRELDTKGRTRGVCLAPDPPDGSLEVLGGAVAYLVLRRVLNAPQAWLPGEETARIGRLAAALQERGLLRDYQAQAVFQGLTGPFGRAIVDVAMGGGKTRICAGLAAVAGGRWLYLVQNQELARQSERSFLELLPQMLTVTGERAEMWATTYAGISQLHDKQFAGVAVDEVHGVAARNRSLAYAELQAAWRVGLSGTPLDRQDPGNALVVGLLGPVVYRVNISDLERQGYLTKGTVRRLVFDHRDGKLKPL